MRLFGGLLVLLLVCVPVTVQADTVSDSQEIGVRATVLPARYIILDFTGRISQILSNTAENVTPSVYRDKIAAGRELPLTAQLLTQYNSLLATVSRPGPGVLYRQAEATVLATMQQPSFISILRQAVSS